MWAMRKRIRLQTVNEKALYLARGDWLHGYEWAGYYGRHWDDAGWNWRPLGLAAFLPVSILLSIGVVLGFMLLGAATFLAMGGSILFFIRASEGIAAVTGLPSLITFFLMTLLPSLILLGMYCLGSWYDDRKSHHDAHQ